MVSAEPALGGTPRRPGIDRRAHVLVAEVDTTLVEVVRRHFHGHAIAGQDTDAVLFHAPGGIGHDLMPIIELHATARIRQDLRDHTFELQHLFLGHAVSLVDGPLCARATPRSPTRLGQGAAHLPASIARSIANAAKRGSLPILLPVYGPPALRRQAKRRGRRDKASAHVNVSAGLYQALKANDWLASIKALRAGSCPLQAPLAGY